MSFHKYGVTFNGRRIVHPGAYDYIDASAMARTGDSSVNIPILVGTSKSGESGKVHWFSDIEPAREYLQGGDLLTGLELLFSPIPEGGGGAGLAGVLIVNETVSAKLVAGGISFESLEYGDGGNKTSVKIENGTISGTKRITANRWDKEITEVYDNLGGLIEITHIGEQAYAVVNTTLDSTKCTKLEIKVGTSQEDAQVDLSIDLTDERFDTVDRVVKYINGTYGYSASHVDERNANVPSHMLSLATNKDIKAKTHLLGNTECIKYPINDFSEVIKVTAVEASITAITPTYFTGGAMGSDTGSWVKSFDILKNEFSDVLVVLSSDESIHAEALAHITQMERRQQRQMMFTGGRVGESVEDTRKRASKLNNSRATLCYPPIYHSAVDKGKKAIPSYFTACVIAGRVCGVDSSEPITFDYVNLVGLSKDLVAGDPEVDTLITSGVCTLERVRGGGIRVAQGITTYLSENNTLYREISVRRGADSLADTIRKDLETTFVGKKGLATTPSAVETRVINRLEEKIKEGVIISYRNIKVRMTGTIVYVDYEVAPVEPINFILITSHFVPQGTLTN